MKRVRTSTMFEQNVCVAKAQPAKSGKKSTDQKWGSILVAVRLQVISRTSSTRRVDGRVLVSYGKTTSKIAGLEKIHGALAQNLYTI